MGKTTRLYTTVNCLSAKNRTLMESISGQMKGVSQPVFPKETKSSVELKSYETSSKDKNKMSTKNESQRVIITDDWKL